MAFVHLHLHTQYSLLDSAIRVGELMPRVKELGMSAVGMTDHGAMYGAIDFQKNAQKHGLKSIIGIEVYMTEDRTDIENKTTYHLILLAKNLEGYKNLIYLNSMAWVEGLVRDRHQNLPRIDFELLSQHKEGLICLSGDLGSEVSRYILRGNVDAARDVIRKYQALFGPDHYYLELTRASLPEYETVTENLIDLSDELEVPVVATNDCHYLRKEDAKAHSVLMAIQLERTIDLDKAIDHGLVDLYVKSPAEMEELFKDIPEAISNTEKIADMCDLVIPTGEVFLPLFDVPDDFERDPDLSKEDLISEYFAHLSREGLQQRFEEFESLGKEVDREAYGERLELEIGVIQKMKFPGYFLIVADFIAWAKSQEIPVGPGRGSGAGSLVAYSLKITDIDPIPYDLLFERFLNPERISMPDFDIDFCTRRRGEVINYVTEKYGESNVAQIVTFGQLKARAVIRDVGRAMNIPLSKVDKISKMIPNEIGITLEKALEKEGRLGKWRAEEDEVDTLFEVSMALENLNRQAGIHAAGLVISDGPLWDYVPVCRGANDEIVSQFAKDEVESAGLVKFDFLGLKTLTVIDDAVRLINQQRHENGEPDFDIRAIPLDDPKVYELIGSGNSTGVFQIESEGFQRLMMQLRPTCFEDIVAAVALYRPGPLGSNMDQEFIACKHGHKEITYLHPLLEDILKPTYGAILYQEQIMKIAQVLSGYSLGQADILRRAMGKKKEDVMKAQTEIFVNGAVEKGVPAQDAAEIFQQILRFAEYGFNKSHSAAYALLTYQTAYLKVHFEVEFVAALLTNAADNADKVVKIINDARQIGVKVLPPDVNHSQLDFSVADGKVRFGFAAIKGVGSNVVEAILESRESSEYLSMYDFCQRVSADALNKKTVESLIISGAFDSIAPNVTDHAASNSDGEDVAAPSVSRLSVADIADNRARMLGAVPTALASGAKKQHDAKVGQFSLFGSMTDEVKNEALEEFYPTDVSMTEREALDKEKKALGFYVIGHPIDRYQPMLGMFGVANADAINDGYYKDRTRVVLAGLVEDLRERTVDDGKARMANFRFEDLTGSAAVTAFKTHYGTFEEILKSGEPILLTGFLKERRSDAGSTFEITLDSVEYLSQARRERVHFVQINLPSTDVTDRQIEQLKSTMQEFSGDCAVKLAVAEHTDDGVANATIPLPIDRFSINLSDQCMSRIEQIFRQPVFTFH